MTAILVCTSSNVVIIFSEEYVDQNTSLMHWFHERYILVTVCLHQQHIYCLLYVLFCTVCTIVHVAVSMAYVLHLTSEPWHKVRIAQTFKMNQANE